MSGPNGHHPLHAPVVDSLFVQLAENNGAGRAVPSGALFRPSVGHVAAGEPEPAQASPNGWPDPPIDLENVPELREAYRWLQEERRRLEEYTRTQFAALQQRHQTILAQHFRNEESLALRTQELNQEMTFLAAQAKIIQERAGELAQREKAVAEQTEKLSQAQQDHHAVDTTLADLQAETARMQSAPRLAANGLAEVEHALKERQAIWEAKQVEIADRLAQMEQRYQALEEAEEAARRRMAELDELENRLTNEFEKQERQLALERRQIETLRARLRLRGLDLDDLESPGTAGRAALGAGR